MITLWILGILVLLLVWLCLTRVGARVTLSGGSTVVDVKFGLFRFRVFPGKKKSKPSKEETTEKPEKPKEKKEKQPLPKPTLTDIRDAVRTLWPPLKRALNRTRRGIRIHPLTVILILGGADDPAAAAEQYGYLQAAIWTGMPVLEKVLDTPEPSIHTDIDFDAPKPLIEGTLGVTARIGTLLGVGLGIAIPALRWFLRFRKKAKEKPPAPQPAA
ncbi:hypothetical protein JQM66_05475 [Oscillibacter valericigenes]|uniref:hypothetical protein n=1 Tax=Oscillibacter valericigenes TaxID=351091 RepID=UPI001F23F8C5|nr:hypothetical protein [Oscillibacter valericigenes]MCF2664010.1 hypothetical protein [Oscillibacter valericigenes]